MRYGEEQDWNECMRSEVATAPTNAGTRVALAPVMTGLRAVSGFI